MKRFARSSALAVLFAAMNSFGVEEVGSRDFLAGNGTNAQWCREISAPVVIVGTMSNADSATKFGQVRVRPQVEVAGARLGMSREQVLKIWGVPRHARNSYEAGAGRASTRLSYGASEAPKWGAPIAHVIFHSETNAVAAMWLDFRDWYEKESLAPKAEECLLALGEPTLRNYIPQPLDPPKQPPKHWYCRMVYRQFAMVLYFGDGRLIALEVNPKAKGVAAEGLGSDEYSIPFCLE